MRRGIYIFLVFSAAFAFIPERAGTDEGLKRKSVVMHKDHFGQGEMEVLHGVRILRLHGTPFEMGYQQGTLLREELAEFQKESYDYLLGYAAEIVDLPQWIIRPLLRPVLHFWARRFIGRIENGHIEEMRGIAHGAGISFNDVLLLNVIWEIGELHSCSEFALSGPATKDGMLWHGYNYDLRGEEQKFLDGYKAVIFYHPEGRQSFVSIGYIGMVGVYTGMNSSGLSIAWDNTRINNSESALYESRRARQVPEPFVFSIRRVMENADSLDEAVNIMSVLKRPLGDIVIISSRDERRAVALQTFSMHSVIREMENGAVWSANCFADAFMGGYDHGSGKLAEWARGEISDDPGLLKKNFSRHVRYAELIKEARGNAGLEDMVKILSDPYPRESSGFIYKGERPICCSKANFSVIYNLDDLVFWVALGRTPAPLDTWVGLDFIGEGPISGKGWPETIRRTAFFDIRDAYAAMQAKDYKRAVSGFERALEIEPDNYRAQVWLLYSLSALGLDDSVKKYNRLFENSDVKDSSLPEKPPPFKAMAISDDGLPK